MITSDEYVQPRVFHTLDALRGIAAIAVVVFHSATVLAPISMPTAYLAVDIFFVMSGIVIAHAYEVQLLTRKLVFGQFMLLRWTRLYPLYAISWTVVVVMIAAALIAGVSNWTWDTFIPAATFSAVMLPNFAWTTRADLYPLNIPAWSLFWELVVNAVYALLIPWLGWRLLLSIIVLAAIAIFATSYTLGSLDYGYTWEYFYVGAIRVLFSFFVGVAILRIVRTSRVKATFSRGSAVLIPLSLLIILALPATLGWIKDASAVVVAFPLLCAAALLTRPFCKRLCTFLGLISYPIYILQVLPREKLASFLLGRPAEFLAPWSGMALVAGLVLFGWLMARFVDPPSRRWLKRRLGAHSGQVSITNNCG